MDGIIGGFRVIRQLGRGGMGTVWLAEDGRGQRVALKVINAELSREPEFRARFRREVEAARRVRRFCTAPVLDAGLEGDPLWVATAYIDGPTVADAVSANGPLRGADLDALAVGIATALTAIHEARLVHRDLKPANVLLSPVGPRVIDFGIARALDAAGRLTLTGMAIGTPGYIAPELLVGGEPLPAADVFSWGAVVAYAGTGRHAFAGATITEINQRVQRAEPDLAGLDPQLGGLVARALAKDPAARPTVPQLLGELTGSATPQPGDAYATHPPAEPNLGVRSPTLLSPGPGSGSGFGPEDRTRTMRAQGPGSPPPPEWREPRRARRGGLYAGIGAVVLVAAAIAAFLLIPKGHTIRASGGPSASRPAASAPAASRPAASGPGASGPGASAPAQPSSPASGAPIYNTYDSSLCVAADGQKPFDPVIAGDCGNSSAQLWNYNTVSDHLVNPASGLCLDTNGTPARGRTIVTGKCGNYSGQAWRYDTGTGHYSNTSSGLCLDTAAPPSDGVTLILDPCGNYSGQGWHM
ncbi:MAG: protein kinase [Nocardiopsaceae bacterium]|nr:protein kinase [Nocardiopsaceae bacterium]